MGYQHIPGGYVDNQALADAIKANRQARNLLRRILEEKPSPALLYQLLAEMAHALGDANAELFTMREIRLKCGDKTEAPGTHPEASTDER